MKRNHAGFSLIELAIVLVVVTILIGGLAVPLSAQIQARRIAETQRTLENARDAVLGYAMTHRVTTPPGTNRYLPCPDADGTGHETLNPTGTNCAQRRGGFPWADLGVAVDDAWGNRLFYAVLPEFSDRSAGFNQTDPTLPPVDPFEIETGNGTVGNVVFVIGSYGPNGRGARSKTGTLIVSPKNTDLDELENLDINSNRFVSRSPSTAGTVGGEFDDLLVWISHPRLIQQVCPSGSDCAPTPGP